MEKGGRSPCKRADPGCLITATLYGDGFEGGQWASGVDKMDRVMAVARRFDGRAALNRGEDPGSAALGRLVRDDLYRAFRGKLKEWGLLRCFYCQLGFAAAPLEDLLGQTDTSAGLRA